VWGIRATLYEAATDVTPFNAEHDTTSGRNQRVGPETGSSTGTDLEAYEQISRRAEPVRVHRRVPVAFAHTVDACLQPDPTRRPTLQELASNLEALS
jgi:hypothetical protein